MAQNPVQPVIKSFLEQAYFGIKIRFGNKLISGSHTKSIQHDIDRLWREFRKRNPALFFLAPGCLVSSLEFSLNYGKIMFRWQTNFSDGPRHAINLQGGIPLGYSNAYDLYALYQPTSQATIIAVSEQERIDWRLHYHNVDPPARVISEGMKRARAVNAFWGSQWAVPKPLGKVAIPYQPR